MHEMRLKPEPQTANKRTYDNYRTDCSLVVLTFKCYIDRFHKNKGAQWAWRDKREFGFTAFSLGLVNELGSGQKLGWNIGLGSIWVRKWHSRRQWPQTLSAGFFLSDGCSLGLLGSQKMSYRITSSVVKMTKRFVVSWVYIEITRSMHYSRLLCCARRPWYLLRWNVMGLNEFQCLLKSLFYSLDDIRLFVVVNGDFVSWFCSLP